MPEKSSKLKTIVGGVITFGALAVAYYLTEFDFGSHDATLAKVKEAARRIEIQEHKRLALRGIGDIVAHENSTWSTLVERTSGDYESGLDNAVSALVKVIPDNFQGMACVPINCQGHYWPATPVASEKEPSWPSLLPECEPIRLVQSVYSTNTRRVNERLQKKPLTKQQLPWKSGVRTTQDLVLLEKCRRSVRVLVANSNERLASILEQLDEITKGNSASSKSPSAYQQLASRHLRNDTVENYNHALLQLKWRCNDAELLGMIYSSLVGRATLADSRERAAAFATAGVGLSQLANCKNSELAFIAYESVFPTTDLGRSPGDARVQVAETGVPGYQAMNIRCIDGISGQCKKGVSTNCGNLILMRPSAMDTESPLLLATVDPAGMVIGAVSADKIEMPDDAPKFETREILGLVCNKAGYKTSKGFLRLTLEMRTTQDNPYDALVISQETRDSTSWLGTFTSARLQ